MDDDVTGEKTRVVFAASVHRGAALDGPDAFVSTHPVSYIRPVPNTGSTLAPSRGS